MRETIADVPVLPAILRPSPWKWLLIAIGGACFVAGGLFVVQHDPSKASWVDWASIAFFGLVATVGLVNLIPGATYLRLDMKGFEMRTLYRAHSTAWADVEGFGVMHVAARKMVGWNYLPGRGALSRLRKFNQNRFGFEAALPDTYGKNAESLAALMETIRGAVGSAR